MITNISELTCAEFFLAGNSTTLEFRWWENAYSVWQFQPRGNWSCIYNIHRFSMAPLCNISNGMPKAGFLHSDGQ